MIGVSPVFYLNALKGMTTGMKAIKGRFRLTILNKNFKIKWDGF